MEVDKQNKQKTDEPLLSIIVPVYQAEAFLPRCIESILQQTFADFELLLVDDGSTDQSFEICQLFASKDARIYIYQLPINQGQAAARNVGLDHARGTYIGFVDADDWIQPTMYEVLFTIIQQKKVDIACCGTKCMKPNGDYFCYTPPAKDIYYFTQQQALESLLDNVWVTSSPTDKLFKRALFSEIRFIHGMTYEDYDKMAVLISKAECVACTSQPLYCYFYSANSTTRSRVSLKNFDEYQASVHRTEFYQTHFAVLSKKAEQIHLTKILSIIYRTTDGDDAVQRKRQELIHLVRNSFTKNFKISLKQKSLLLKVCLLQINSFLYVKAMDVYYQRKKNQQWHHAETSGDDL